MDIELKDNKKLSALSTASRGQCFIYRKEVLIKSLEAEDYETFTCLHLTGEEAGRWENLSAHTTVLHIKCKLVEID